MKKVIEAQIEMLEEHIKIYKNRGNQAAVEHAKELIKYYQEQLKKYQ